MSKGSPGCSARSRSATATEDICENRPSALSVRIVIGMLAGGCQSTMEVDSVTARPAHPCRTSGQTEPMSRIGSSRRSRQELTRLLPGTRMRTAHAPERAVVRIRYHQLQCTHGLCGEQSVVGKC